MANLSAEEVIVLVDALRRNFLYVTPTPVFRNGETVRFNVTMHAPDYLEMMDLIERAGGWTMPAHDKAVVAVQFARKAKTAGAGYALSSWNMGDIEAALEDTKDIDHPELVAFRTALHAEIERRGCIEAPPQAALPLH